LAATGLVADAKEFVDDHRVGFGLLFPWRAVAAWRLSKEVPLVDELRQAAEVKDTATRRRLEDVIKQRVVRSRSPLVTDEVGIAVWSRFADEADEVAQSYHVLRVAVALQAWQTVQGMYPADADVLSLPLERYGLRYVQTKHGHGYRLFNLSSEPPTLLLERLPRG
jgi:hypothetical protein